MLRYTGSVTVKQLVPDEELNFYDRKNGVVGRHTFVVDAFDEEDAESKLERKFKEKIKIKRPHHFYTDVELETAYETAN